MSNTFTRIIFVSFFILSASHSSGQQKLFDWLKVDADSVYVEFYRDEFIPRIFASRKYVAYRLIDKGENLNLNYTPANNIVYGIGFNYKWLGLNIGFNFPFAKKNQDEYGETYNLDLQSHMYLEKITLDFFTHYYKGQYLFNTREVLNGQYQERFYIRNDISSYSFGLDLHYNFNSTRYTLSGPYLQNTRQKKSNGTFMAGAGLYIVGANADSSFIPSKFADRNFFDGLDFDRWRFFSLHINGGYAYTFVIFQRIFFMTGLSVGLGVGNSSLFPVEGNKQSEFGFNASVLGRVALGYHYKRLYVGASWAGINFFVRTPSDNTRIEWYTGNFRANIAYRFKTKREYYLLPWEWKGKK